jgi:hypothetical protein
MHEGGSGQHEHMVVGEGVEKGREGVFDYILTISE